MHLIAPVVHTHNQSDVNGLESALAGKADINHNHDGTYSPVSHNHDGVYQKKYAGVAVVARSGGDYADPLTAMNNISAWCGTPSATNSCLLKIMPGVYDIGSNSLQMQSYVDIEGSGENVTRIKGNITNGGYSEGLVHGANYAEIRFLTIENTATDYGMAVYNLSAAPRITNVTIVTYDTTHYFGVFNFYSSPIMTNVTLNSGIYNALSDVVMKNVACSGFIFNQDSQMHATNLTVTDSDLAVHNQDGYMTIDNSSITAPTTVFAGGGTTYISHTKLDGSVYTNGGILKCIGVFDGNYDPVVCP